MSESSDRLDRTRLAILQAMQKKQESRTSLADKVRNFASGFSRGAPAAQAMPSGPAPVAPKPQASPSAQEALASAPAQAPAEAHAAHIRAAAADREEAHAEAHPEAPGNDAASRKARRAHRLFSGRFAGLGEAGRDYWNHHPAHLVVELATPVLAKYAQRKPVTYLAVAAAAGALIVIARPWRMLSVSGLAIAALRSPQLSSALISALYGTGSEEGAVE